MQELELQCDVVDILTAAGRTATVEWPGAVAIEYDEGRRCVWTGLTGWDYGSTSYLDEDDCWQPDEGHSLEAPQLDEHETDKKLIAAVWLGVVVDEERRLSEERAAAITKSLGRCSERIWDPRTVVKWPHLYRCPNEASTTNEEGKPVCADHDYAEEAE